MRVLASNEELNLREFSLTKGFYMKNSSKVRPFSSAHSLAELVIILLAICASINLVAIAVNFSGTLTQVTDLITTNGTLSIVGTLQGLAPLIAWIFFLIWFYRAHGNLRALGVRRGRYSSRWSILLFFVPLLNLYYTYDLVKELWKQSSPDLGLSDDFLKQHAATPEQYPSKTALVGWWWGFTIASIVAARTSLTMDMLGAGTSDQITAVWITMISDALAITASIMLILVVKKIDVRQDEKHRRLTLDAATQTQPTF